jgi:hypothetical protein
MTTEAGRQRPDLSDGLGAGSDLYLRALAFNDDDPERKALMAKVWCGTPWMVDAYTGSHDSARRHELMEWCREQFGPEAWPIHGHAGQWHSGCATVDGWTWMGFATEDQMHRFVERWPAPNAG